MNEETTCDYIRDPYLVDETNPQKWMCQECIDIKKDDI